MNKLFCFAILFFTVFTAKVQDDASTTKSVTNLSIISPALTHEMAIGKRQTIFVAAQLGLIARYENINNTTTNAYYGLILKLTADFRNYYNFERRLLKGKNIDNNSGNYLALRTGYTFAPTINKDQFTNYNNGFMLGGVWGIQRVYNSGIYLGLSLGGGILFGNQKLDYAGMGDFHLGFNIGASSKK